MNPKHIKRFAGRRVIVQFRDAMAIGEQSGDVLAAPIVNADGKLLLKKDGSVAPDDAKPEDIAVRPEWPIAVRQEGAPASAVFRYAIENAVVSVIEQTLSTTRPLAEHEAGIPPLVSVVYQQDRVLYELVVNPDAIVGITCIQQGPMPEKPAPRIVVPGN